MQVRTSLARRVSQVTQWGSFVFVGGMLFGIPILMGVGGVMLASLTLFALVTLPVEHNASDRALSSLKQMGLADAGEIQRVRQVLRATAFT